MATSPRSRDPSAPRIGLGEFVRLGWMLVGFNGMLLAATWIAMHPVWTFGWRDAAFWGAVLLSAVFRYLDISRFNGETAAGRPATKEDLRNYLFGLTLCASASWVLAHSVHLQMKAPT